MKRVIIATRNRGKIQEIKNLLQGTDCEVLSMDEAGIHKDITEDGLTLMRTRS